MKTESGNLVSTSDSDWLTIKSIWLLMDLAWAVNEPTYGLRCQAGHMWANGPTPVSELVQWNGIKHCRLHRHSFGNAGGLIIIPKHILHQLSMTLTKSLWKAVILELLWPELDWSTRHLVWITTRGSLMWQRCTVWGFVFLSKSAHFCFVKN